MNKVFLAGLGAAFLALGSIAAQADLVQFPSGPAAWTVDISPSKNAPPPSPNAPPHIVRLQVQQDDQKRRSIITLSNGSISERWGLYQAHLILAEEPNTHILAVRDDGISGALFALPYTAASFSWLKNEMLVSPDPVSYQGKTCLHYLGQVEVTATFNGSGAVSGKYEAWVDIKTGFPVAMEDPRGLAVFTFQKDPPPPLSIPTKFLAVYNRLMAK